MNPDSTVNVSRTRKENNIPILSKSRLIKTNHVLEIILTVIALLYARD